MKKLAFVLLALTFIVTGSQNYAQAVTLDFENLPDTYYYNNLGNYYSGVTFGPGATKLTSPNYNYQYYPPRSGSTVLYTGQYPYIDVAFDDAVSDFSLWYSVGDTISVSAYSDAGMSNVLGSVSGGYNLLSNSQLALPYSGIKAIRINGTPNYFTIDDVSFNQNTAVPEPASMSLLGLGLAGLLRFRKRKI